MQYIIISRDKENIINRIGKRRCNLFSMARLIARAGPTVYFQRFFSFDLYLESSATWWCGRLWRQRGAHKNPGQTSS